MKWIYDLYRFPLEQSKHRQHSNLPKRHATIVGTTKNTFSVTIFFPPGPTFYSGRMGLTSFSSSHSPQISIKIFTLGQYHIIFVDSTNISQFTGMWKCEWASKHWLVRIVSICWLVLIEGIQTNQIKWFYCLQQGFSIIVDFNVKPSDSVIFKSILF